jgi:hypothetical protein
MLQLLTLLVLSLTKSVQMVFGQKDKYLYAVMKPDDFWPIKEFQPNDAINIDDQNYTPPAFLTNRYNSNRIVEFYAVSLYRELLHSKSLKSHIFRVDSMFATALVWSLSTIQATLH